MSGVAAAWPGRLRRDRLARALLLGAGAAAAGYGAYRLYHSEPAASARRQLARLRAALAAYADAFGTGADTLQQLLADFRAFLQSDRSEVPPSLRQLARLMQAREVSDAASAATAALVRGVAAGVAPARHAAALPSQPGQGAGEAAAPAATAGPSGGDALGRVLDALLSERGQGLVSVAVSLGARNLVAAYCEAQQRGVSQQQRGGSSAVDASPDLAARALDFLASRRGQQLAVACVAAFVSAGMRSYLDQTLDINFYEDLFSAMAQPRHLEAVKAVVGVFARDVVGAYLAGPQAAAANGGQLRLSSSIQEMMGAAAAAGGSHAAEESGAAADSGSPCGSSASGEWRQAAAAAAPSEADSDVVLRPRDGPAAAKATSGGGDDSARSHDVGGWAVRTPPQAGETEVPQQPRRPQPPQLRRVQAAAAEGGSLSREGSGNLEWISAVGKEWLNVAQHPAGRSVMVELAGAAAKEAARGVGAAVADHFRLQWALVAACAALLLAWLAQRLLGTLLA